MLASARFSWVLWLLTLRASGADVQIATAQKSIVHGRPGHVSPLLYIEQFLAVAAVVEEYPRKSAAYPDGVSARHAKIMGHVAHDIALVIRAVIVSVHFVVVAAAAGRNGDGCAVRSARVIGLPGSDEGLLGSSDARGENRQPEQGRTS